MGRCSKLRKSEKLKKIQLLLNQKNLYEDQYERLLAATGDWKSNYTDYLITEPIDLVEELKRVPEADYELCTALLTMLVKEEIPENASDKTFVDHKGLLILERMNEILSAGAREDEKGRYTKKSEKSQSHTGLSMHFGNCRNDAFAHCTHSAGIRACAFASDFPT